MSTEVKKKIHDLIILLYARTIINAVDKLYAHLHEENIRIELVSVYYENRK